MIEATLILTSGKGALRVGDGSGRTLNEIFHAFDDLTGSVIDTQGEEFKLPQGAYRLIETRRHDGGAWEYRLVRLS